MVFKHNKFPFDHDNSTCQLDFQQIRQLDCDGLFPSSAARQILEKQYFPDGVRPGGNLEVDNMTSEDNSGVSKRPFAGEENLEGTHKRSRQMDGKFSLSRSTCTGPFTYCSVTADDEFKRRMEDVVPESANDYHGNSFSFPSFTSDEDTRFESPAHLPFFPEYYEHRRPTRYINRVEEFQSPFYNYYPRKLVAIGRNHQVDIPEWRPKSFQDFDNEDFSDAATSSLPKSNLPIGRGKTECGCYDKGSVRCVRKHITEAREQLKTFLGCNRFEELGLCEMGEDVALGWTEEEEELFHEVVESNPASRGKNFWDELAWGFPSRTNKELVSYYFNVFMFRKRAQQNRSDPFNADSDNDEWQESDDADCHDDDDGDDDDSGVESPAYEYEYKYAAEDRAVYIHEDAKNECNEEFLGDMKSKFETKVQFGGDQDVPDDSCTSYESQHNVLDHGLGIEHCDEKPWEMMGYIRGLDKELDLLPTCNWIEEVFGNETWEKSSEGRGVS